MPAMVNPYLCYAFSFIFALLTYLLGWSSLYPPLSFSLLAFILTTVAIHLVIGLVIVRKKLIVFNSIEQQHVHTPVFITLGLYLLWSAEFIHEGGIPLLKILLKQPYDYRLFGIPSLHVFIVTFSSFYTIYLFHTYLSSRSKLLLFLYLINLMAAILIYSRAMLFFNLTASFFLYLFSVKRIPVKTMLWFGVGTVFLLYFFGALGTLRVSREAKSPYNNSLFLQTGSAQNEFINSSIPKEFFWSYMYISSPLANLQHNINTYPSSAISTRRVLEMVNNEVGMDFISKRINTLLVIEREKENTIPGPFNVSTVYSRAYSYLGWYGMVIMMAVVLVMPWLYTRIVSQDSPFFLTGFSILSTMFLFLAYDNTIRFTGLSFQLVYPVVLTFATPRIPLLKKIFL